MKNSEMFLKISYSENMNNFISSFSIVKNYYDQKNKCYSDDSDIYDDAAV